jgi:hypothetical protein
MRTFRLFYLEVLIAQWQGGLFNRTFEVRPASGEAYPGYCVTQSNYGQGLQVWLISAPTIATGKIGALMVMQEDLTFVASIHIPGFSFDSI